MYWFYSVSSVFPFLVMGPVFQLDYNRDHVFSTTKLSVDVDVVWEDPTYRVISAD